MFSFAPRNRSALWPAPWPVSYPWDYAWLIPVAVLLGEKGLEEAHNLCDAVRKKGREHGGRLAFLSE